MSNFLTDLSFGQSYEKKAATYFKYRNIDFAKGRCKGYDFILDGFIKIEVKSDRMAHKTGNLAIEYKCNNKPSGISTTEAVKYVYFVKYPSHDDCYIIPVDELKKICKKKGRSVRGGDGWRSKMWLVNKKYLKSFLR